METSFKKAQTGVNNIIYIINKSTSELKTLQLDYIRNKEVYSVCNSVLNDILIIEQILQSSNLLLPIEIANNVNQIFIADKTVSSVIVNIVNSKRTIKDCPAYLTLKV
jgi:hypothetical protein